MNNSKVEMSVIDKPSTKEVVVAVTYHCCPKHEGSPMFILLPRVYGPTTALSALNAGLRTWHEEGSMEGTILADTHVEFHSEHQISGVHLNELENNRHVIVMLEAALNYSIEALEARSTVEQEEYDGQSAIH